MLLGLELFEPHCAVDANGFGMHGKEDAGVTNAASQPCIHTSEKQRRRACRSDCCNCLADLKSP